MRQNVHAKHGDSRIEQLRRKYGNMAEMKVDDLRQQARKVGIEHTSEKRKEELLKALSSQHGGGRRK
jgi:dihydroxyacetone kinase-like predicted kinase